jgi:uncharacterized YigZ family protein
MQIFSFQTIQAPTEGLYKEKGSKFLAFTFPVTSENDVKEKLEYLRKEYYDARHHCFAYVIGADRSKYRAFDDGEPNHSAGDPILGQIKSRQLTNVLVVVIRYFGGVKLGVGGLISAYKLAAEDALNKCRIVEEEVTDSVTLEFDYNVTPEVMRLVKDFDLKIVQQDFTTNSRLVLRYRIEISEKLFEKIKLLNALGHPIVARSSSS